MKSIYITSLERYSGKTAICLALGKRLLADGFSVGYLKPLSLQPWRISGQIADEDAAFVKEILHLDVDPWQLSPVVVTPEFLVQRISAGEETNMMEQVKSAVAAMGKGKDVLLLEGGASLREGHAVSLPTPDVARELSSHVLVTVKYRDNIRVLDDTISAKVRLGDLLSGVVINRVPLEATDYIHQLAIPFLEKRGIPVLAALPEKRRLAALTVSELVEVLNAEVLTQHCDQEAMVETLTVGAMTADAALHRFREYTNKAVITGGDRTDIQLAALETSTTCLILTGNLQPSPLIVKQAEDFGVSVLLVRENTMETVEAIERIFGKTRLGQPDKLAEFESIFAENMDFDQFYRILGLSSS
ncbi:MAG: phosphotransacetylase family protein [Chloroflexota bacterium]|nr:MAG: phosphotransacetylase family protein [Chloroflexota bacterium]